MGMSHVCLRRRLEMQIDAFDQAVFSIIHPLMTSVSQLLVNISDGTRVQ